MVQSLKNSSYKKEYVKVSEDGAFGPELQHRYKDFFNEINFWKQAKQHNEKILADGFIVYSGNETEKRTYGTFLSWRDLIDFKVLGL